MTQTDETTTTNGMKAYSTIGNEIVSLFYNIGASRGKDIIPAFSKAYAENSELALRVAMWARDVRGGAGERKLFRDILNYLEVTDPDAAKSLLPKIPEIGRWDDIFVFKTPELKHDAFTLAAAALRASNGLMAKWAPREKSAKSGIAQEFRKFLGWSPKYYRKTLVALTNVVEQKMCANAWDDINFNHVPSLASTRYKKAFARHTPNFATYVQALIKGDPSVKINTAAVYPYDVLKGIGNYGYNKIEQDHVIAQWDALPNYIGNASILPLVDVSGSMTCSAGGNSSITCMDVAISLGLYVSDKNTGKFKDTFLTFSTNPELITLQGNIVEKALQMKSSNWAMSTNLNAAFDKILAVATQFNVPPSEMPEILLILSDMVFDSSVSYNETAMEMIERKYKDAGYTPPSVVFWNINASGNSPVKSHKSKAALVSGFSPSLLLSVLSADMDEFTPEGICLKTIMVDRYSL